MGDFEEKLNGILSSPREMEKIMDIARSLSQSAPKVAEKQTEPKLSFGDIDPKMIGLMGRLMKEYNTNEGDKTALLSAIKPYLREENRAVLDKAGGVLKLTKLAKIAFTEFGGFEK